MIDVIESFAFDYQLEEFKKHEAKGIIKIVTIDDAVNHGGVAEYQGKKLYYIAWELEIEDRK